MLPNETILNGASPVCCGKKLEFKVLQSAAGYYIGTFCPNCGPYSRETDYYKDRKLAEINLSNNDWHPRE